jgi:hypothetical protein
MRLYLTDNFLILIERYAHFLRNSKQKFIHFICAFWGKCLHIFREDIAFFTSLYRTIRRDWKHSLLLLIIFISFGAALLFYLNGKAILAAILFTPGFVIYFVVLWQVARKVEAKQIYYAGKYVVRKNVFKVVNRKTKSKTSTYHDFNPISFGTLHFGVALSLWSAWVTNQMSDDRTLVIAIIFSIMSAAFFIAVYNKPTRDFINIQAAPYVISLSFWTLLAGFILGIFEALPDFPQTLFVNRVIVQIVVYFGFAWIVTILLAMLRDAGNELVRVLVLAFLIFVGVTEVVQKDLVSKIGGIALFSIFLIGYLVSTNRLHPYGDIYEK